MSHPTDAIVIGGSIAGLMHALVLKSLGRTVRVLEARPYHELQARAAGLSLWPHAQQLIATYAPDIDLDAIAFRNCDMQILTGDGFILAETPVLDDIRTSSWAVVHRMLWKSCKKRCDNGGLVKFETGQRVCSMEEQGDRMVVVYKGTDGLEKTESASLVIAADGARSYARSQLLPAVVSEYAGYLAWRGNFSEKLAPQELAGVLEGQLATFMFGGSYVLAYLTPGLNGDMTPGERVVEWCWYDTCDISSSLFEDFMTDKNGIRHNFTVPADQLRLEAWQTQLDRRWDGISSLWKRLFETCTLERLPLLTAIRSFDNSEACFLGGKLLLAGEAFTQIRPHLGASCSIAALQASSLGKVFNKEQSWEEAQLEVLQYATKQSIASRATGIWGLTGEWPEDYSPAFAQA